ncbi:hypothetical protein [Haladaptatus litoreus]|uniref:hypothetical protein n=1 Tax=Haladaptatus litoreus TaxID=553468 RepID=UPI001FE47C6E|nr:hypothetical protein [Haladaptatus litoreus]
MSQLVGEFCETARDHIRDTLAERLPRFVWETEHPDSANASGRCRTRRRAFRRS